MKAKADWLRRFLVLKNGIPSRDTFLRVFRVLDPNRQWFGHIASALDGQLAIDGKTLRGSANGDQPPVHMVSAFATKIGFVLGQEKVAGKSNEIIAIPALLEALYLKGFLVSIDAMGCQKNIAARIVDKGGDYLLAVKGNQPTLQRRIETFIVDRGVTGPTHEQTEKSHGRLVVQIAQTAPAEGIVDPVEGAHCKTVGRIEFFRIVNGKPSELEQRLYISSRHLTAEELATAVREHWAIGNRLHWMLDINFGEDDSMVPPHRTSLCSRKRC